MRSFLFLSSLASLLLTGCFPSIGNSDGNCAAGTTCVCDGIGNCDRSCTGGNCDFVCRGIGNCLLSCEGGGCDVTCEGTGNCILDCAGGSCSQTCDGTGTCQCETGCETATTDSGVTVDAGTAL